MNTENLWAILREDGELACWRGSRGVPFMSPSKELVISTLQDLDVIDDPGIAEVIPVTAKTVEDLVVIFDQNNQMLTLLGPARKD